MRRTNNNSQWQTRPLGELCELTGGRGFGPSDWSTSGLPIIRIQNLNGSDSFNYFAGKPEPEWTIQPGTILFAWAGTKGVSFGPTIWRGKTGVLNQHIYRVTPRSEIDPRWLYRVLRVTSDQIENRAHGFKSTLLHVSKRDITKQRVSVPPLAEQRHIADILDSWDNALDTLARAIRAKERRHRAIMLRLVSVSAQPRSQTKEWKRARLDSFLDRVTRRNFRVTANVLTTSAQRGLVNQTEYFTKSIASADLSSYFLIHRGEFAYNRSSSAGYPFGAIKRLDAFESGVLSTLNLCFRISSPEVDSDFLLHFFEGGMLNRGLHSICHEGARNHGLLNVTASDFFSLSVVLPPLQQQRRIAATLNASATELRLLREQHAALAKQKRGLMQLLLTGKKRVRV
jgi:type I restriction enzyme S subunit